MTADTSETGLEALIVRSLIDEGGYIAGDPKDYDRDHAIDTAQLFAFLKATQPEAVETLGIGAEGLPRLRFLDRLRSEIDRRGVVDVLRKGVRHGPGSVELLYGAPTPGNARAEGLFAANVFGVTRQLRYSKDETRLALDLALFVNGLPVATFELKNSLTKQTAEDAIEQYRRDRDPKELLFRFGRCVVHFAVDDREARMCTYLRGKDSWFLPFDKGWNDGAGNPPNAGGLKTDYLWREVLARDSLTDILENYAQIVSESDERGRKTERKQTFPRFHQLDAVRRLLADAETHGAGKRYLIQHSAGSGKSNSIAWLAHRLIGPGDRRRADLRFRRRRDRPADPRQADPRHHPAVRAGVLHRRPRGTVRRPSRVSPDRKEDRRHDGAEVPLRPGRDRRRASGAEGSPSSSTRRIRARAAARRRPCTWRWERARPPTARTTSRTPSTA